MPKNAFKCILIANLLVHSFEMLISFQDNLRVQILFYPLYMATFYQK